MDPHDLAARDGEQTERIALAQVRLVGEWQSAQVFKGPKILCTLHTCCLEGLCARRHGLQLPFDRGAQPLELQSLETFAWQRLRLAVPDHAANDTALQ